MPKRSTVLLESWLPFDAIGAESLRERGASSALPPLYFLHIWWARRPLTISRAAIVASLLPDYDTVAAPRLQDRFPTEGDCHAWFLRLMGIHGDPVAARSLLLRARQQGKFIPNPYTHDRAFTVNPAPEDLALLEERLAFTWGDEIPLREFVQGGPLAGWGGGQRSQGQVGRGRGQ